MVSFLEFPRPHFPVKSDLALQGKLSSGIRKFTPKLESYFLTDVQIPGSYELCNIGLERASVNKLADFTHL